MAIRGKPPLQQKPLSSELFSSVLPGGRYWAITRLALHYALRALVRTCLKAEAEGSPRGEPLCVQGQEESSAHGPSLQTVSLDRTADDALSSSITRKCREIARHCVDVFITEPLRDEHHYGAPICGRANLGFPKSQLP
jgi:hypothetical protein